MTNESKPVADPSIITRILSAVISLVLAITVFTSTAYAEGDYQVEIVDNNVIQTITTTETDPIEILAKFGYTLDKGDKLDVSQFIKGEGGKITINRLNTINVNFNGTINTYDVYETTVANALSGVGIVLTKDAAMNYDANDAVTDGMVITIDTPYAVSITANGSTGSYSALKGTVSDVVENAGIKIDSNDYTSPSLSTNVVAGMKIKVYKVSYKNVTKTEKIKYQTVTKKDKKLDSGKKKTVQKGKNGSKKVTYKVKYVNGKAQTTKKVKSVTTKKATKKIVKVGTKKTWKATPNGVKSKNGYTVGQKITGRFTHYCACGKCGTGTGRTASGRKVYNGMKDPHYIACNWLPMGSVVAVDGVEYTVVDRGGSGLSRVGRIDIFTPAGHATCYKLGVGSCKLEIVRLGW